MYEKILVPLDGSKLAEAVLPNVEEIARNCSTQEVILVSVTERVVGRQAIPAYGYPGTPEQGSMPRGGWATAPEPVGEPQGGRREVPVGVGKKQRQAERYLNRIAKTIQSKGIKVSTEVLLGDPSEEIKIYAELNHVDLIAMSSHGRSGVSRWAHGSVADRVFRSVNVPVLMVRAPGSTAGV